MDQQVNYGMTYYYKVTATDDAGNQGSASAEVIGRSIDTESPVISITSPINGNSFGTDDEIAMWSAPIIEIIMDKILLSIFPDQNS